MTNTTPDRLYRAYFEEEVAGAGKPHSLEAQTKQSLLTQLVEELKKLNMDNQVVIIALYFPTSNNAQLVDRQPDGTFRSSYFGDEIEL